MKQSSKVRVSVVGLGHMGAIHAKKLIDIPNVDLVGVYDIKPELTKKIAEELNTENLKNFEQCLEISDAIVLATPTETHGRMGHMVLTNGLHLMVEKPMTYLLDEAEILLNVAEEMDLTFIVGHVENFNPAWVAAREYIKKPLFVEAHRLTPFRSRSTNISVIDDLMIHDLELLAQIVDHRIESIHTSLTPVLTQKPDIANARLKFRCGTVANLTASRLSVHPKRKMRIFQKDSYISVDFQARKTEIYRLAQKNPIGDIIQVGEAKLERIVPQIQDVDPIDEELKFFINCIINEERPTYWNSFHALVWAKAISEMGASR